MVEQLSTPVAAIALPVAFTDLPRMVDDLAAEHGPGLQVTQDGQFLVVSTPGRQCHCGSCEDARTARLVELTGEAAWTGRRFMIVCPVCGDKRCPRAAHHDHPCQEDR